MREADLMDQLGALAGRLDEASAPVDVEWILDAPRISHARGRRSLYGVLGVAAMAAFLATIVLSRSALDGDHREAVVSETRPQVDLLGVEGRVADGQLVEVAGTGFPPGSEVSVRQCAPAGCDEWRPAAQVTADEEGRFTAELKAYREIATGRGTVPGDPLSPDWFACAPCELRADTDTDTDAVTAAGPLEVAATAQPQHPTLRIATPGPYQPGQPVRLLGSGFQPDPDGLDVSVAYCPAGAQRAEECGGGPDLGDLGIGPDGTFVVEAFELPAADVVLGGTRCVDRPGACVLTWLLSTPGPLPDGLPLDLSA